MSPDKMRNLLREYFGTRKQKMIHASRWHTQCAGTNGIPLEDAPPTFLAQRAVGALQARFVSTN
jgi:hypothetical protein